MGNIIEYQSAVKKNLIDWLMFSLYADARTIYREYVQNALDAINAAVKQGVLRQLKDGVVNINIDASRNNIVIRDNGTGITADMAIPRLLDISASPKDGVTTAGQFGIGRLVGGGYCHRLVFKTSAKDESVATIVTFDVDRIWKMVKEEKEDYLASYVIDKCTIVEQVEENVDEHYFEVTLHDVKTDTAPILLKDKEVISYLNMVAPVAYSSEFTNGVIYHSLKAMPEYEELQENLEKVQVFVDDCRIEKQYGLKINGTKDDIDRLEYFKVETKEYGLLAWGWFALTKFSIQIPKEDELACIRLRKHNIQIGDFNLLSGKPLWKEERGNSYFYGELFVTHKNIVPNAARDGLAPTPEKEALYLGLETKFKELHGIYTKANTAKKAIEKIQDGAKKLEESNNATDRIAIDNINNKGIEVYKKLVNSASSLPMKHMLKLYEESFNEACDKVEKIKKEINTSKQKENAPKDDALITGKDMEDRDSQRVEEAPENKTGQIENQEHTQWESNGQGMERIDKNIPTSDSQDPEKRNSSNLGKDEQSFSPNITIRRDYFAQLKKIMSEDELWILRRVFRVLNTYCPKNEHDQHLIDILQKEIVREFENE